MNFCAVLFCPEIVQPKHTSLDTTATIYQTVVKAECNPGFILPDGNSSLSVQCLDSAQWSSSLPICLGLPEHLKPATLTHM